jgi:hypothetical protein
MYDLATAVTLAEEKITVGKLRHVSLMPIMFAILADRFGIFFVQQSAM